MIRTKRTGSFVPSGMSVGRITLMDKPINTFIHSFIYFPPTSWVWGPPPPLSSAESKLTHSLQRTVSR